MCANLQNLEFEELVQVFFKLVANLVLVEALVEQIPNIRWEFHNVREVLFPQSKRRKPTSFSFSVLGFFRALSGA